MALRRSLMLSLVLFIASEARGADGKKVTDIATQRAKKKSSKKDSNHRVTPEKSNGKRRFFSGPERKLGNAQVNVLALGAFYGHRGEKGDGNEKIKIGEHGHLSAVGAPLDKSEKSTANEAGRNLEALIQQVVNRISDLVGETDTDTKIFFPMENGNDLHVPEGQFVVFFVDKDSKIKEQIDDASRVGVRKTGLFRSYLEFDQGSVGVRVYRGDTNATTMDNGSLKTVFSLVRGGKKKSVTVFLESENS